MATLAPGEAGRAAGGDVEDSAAEARLMGKALGERHAVALDSPAAVGEHRLLRERRDLLGELEGAIEMAARLDDLVDEADPVRLLGVDGAAGEDHLEGAAHADDPWQALGAAVDQGHAPSPLEETEGRAAGGDPQVAPERQLDASRQAPALDRGDRGL